MLLALQHIVLSHHGQYEFGSPKLPAIPEAIAIHYLDNLDAKINMFLNEIEADRDPADRWTNFNTALGTKVYKVDPMGIRSAGK
jgi:3'-5' exoribonuclease